MTFVLLLLLCLSPRWWHAWELDAQSQFPLHSQGTCWLAASSVVPAPCCVQVVRAEMQHPALLTFKSLAQAGRASVWKNLRTWPSFPLDTLSILHIVLKISSTFPSHIAFVFDLVQPCFSFYWMIFQGNIWLCHFDHGSCQKWSITLLNHEWGIMNFFFKFKVFHNCQPKSSKHVPRSL